MIQKRRGKRFTTRTPRHQEKPDLFCVIREYRTPAVQFSIVARGAGMGLLVVLAIACGAIVLRLRRTRTAERRALRALSGLCLHCGYDLTTNTSNVCPECGRWIWIE
jgi:hypothetical protein